MAGEIPKFAKTFKMVSFINDSIKQSSKRFNCKLASLVIFVVYDRMEEILKVVEARREQFKKKYALKF